MNQGNHRRGGPRTHARTSRSRRAIVGVTVMEVMMSIGVLTLGIGGIVGAQKATILANRNARTIANANAIAASWAERLQADALQWNAPRNAADDLATDTVWLKNATPIVTTASWFNPTEVLPLGTGPAGSPDTDILGTDIYPGDPAAGVAKFCTKMRLQQLSPAFPKLIRAEVRVFWDRSGHPTTCIATPDPETAGDTHTYGFVSIVTLVEQNTAL